MKKYLAASLAVWVWILIWDNFLGALLVGSSLGAIPGMLPEFSKLWETVGDLFAALVVTGMYARVRGVFGTGLAGGATYGVYAGLLVNFPTWLFMVVYAGWPYGPTWVLTIAGVGLVVVEGAIMGLVYQTLDGAKTAQA